MTDLKRIRQDIDARLKLWYASQQAISQAHVFAMMGAGKADQREKVWQTPAINQCQAVEALIRSTGTGTLPMALEHCDKTLEALGHIMGSDGDQEEALHNGDDDGRQEARAAYEMVLAVKAMLQFLAHDNS